MHHLYQVQREYSEGARSELGDTTHRKSYLKAPVGRMMLLVCLMECYGYLRPSQNTTWGAPDFEAFR